MKFKYFIRGLGAGILFTTIIVMFYYNSSGYKKMTDKDVENAALSLGMVYKEEKDVDLSGLNAKSDETQADSTTDDTNTNGKSEDNTDKVNNTTDKLNSTTDTTNNQNTDTDTSSSSDNSKMSGKDNSKINEVASDKTDSNDTNKTTEDDTKTDKSSKKDTNKTDIKNDSKFITIVIKPGMYSSSVAKLLVDEGIIDNEQSMIDFLEDQDWQLDIRAGEYKIPKQTTLKEIAEILTHHKD